MLSFHSHQHHPDSAGVYSMALDHQEEGTMTSCFKLALALARETQGPVICVHKVSSAPGSEVRNTQFHTISRGRAKL